MPIGLALNNPGNIRSGGSFKYVGELANSANTSFRQFVDLKSGYRAIAEILYTYFVKKGINTIGKMIATYAPFGDGANNPTNYAAFVSKQTGIDVNQVLTIDDFKPSFLGLGDANMLKVIRAISQKEVSYSDDTASADGYQMFLDDNNL